MVSHRSVNHEIQEPDGAKQESVLENREKEAQGPAVTDVSGCVCVRDSDQKVQVSTGRKKPPHV